MSSASKVLAQQNRRERGWGKRRGAGGLATMTEHYLGRVRVILYTFQKHSIVSQYNHTSRKLLAELKDKREQKQGVSNSYKKE